MNLRLTVLTVVVLCATLSFGAERYPLRVGADHRHLVDQNGTPFLVQGDAAWSLISGLTKEEAEKYLEARRRLGFNSIIVNLIEHKFRGPVNRYGEGPFITLGDFSTPNEKYFAHADWVIRKAQEKGIVVFLAPIYLGYIGLDEGWVDELKANGPEKARNWGRYVGKRYRDFDNIVWIIGGDRNPDKVREDVDAVAAGINEADERHLLTAHCHPENSAIDQYANEGWLDLNSTYTYGIVHQKLRVDYDRQPPMPFVLIETTYEGEHNASAVQIRRQAYWAILSGATGQFMGNRPMWLFDPGWEAALDSVGSQNMSRLYSLFRSRPWDLLVPDEKHEVVVDGLGEFNGMDYLTAARAGDGSLVMGYLPSARTITLQMNSISGKQAVASWFNPRTGDWTKIGEFPPCGKKDFTPPAKGDWVFVMERSTR
ncbi:MAG TPA: glycoside hydrolase family 140 protein [Candidatus Sulfotelmatobacter sp.]|nr:glycoside hydrolase family 140 protein [Candidatus Sulfotelmatobacter sp.]